jgi:hypothetical protein
MLRGQMPSSVDDNPRGLDDWVFIEEWVWHTQCPSFVNQRKYRFRKLQC